MELRILKVFKDRHVEEEHKKLRQSPRPQVLFKVSTSSRGGMMSTKLDNYSNSKGMR